MVRWGGAGISIALAYLVNRLLESCWGEEIAARFYYAYSSGHEESAKLL